MKKYFPYLLLVVLTVAACVPPGEEVAEDDVLLAKVYNKTLYLSEMDGMISKGSTPEDSLLIVNAFVERWAREVLMLREAERNVPQDLNIDKLVRDYRASLILHNYERSIVETELDSIISEEEYTQYYEKHKDHFQLETSIMRCNFMKIPKDAPNKSKVEKWWNGNRTVDKKMLSQYCETHATLYHVEDTIWHKVDEIAVQFPKGALSVKTLKEGKDFTMSEGDFNYYFRLLEASSENNDPPFTYVKEMAKKYILHNRKMKLVEQKREQVFRKAEKMGHVKYFH